MLPLPAGVTLGRTIEPEERRVSSGNAALDELLEGGFPRGRLCEVSGPAFSGRTTLLYQLLAAVSGEGSAERIALIDAADAFDPSRAMAAGARLPAILWVRPRDARSALRCAEIVLGIRGFALVAVDLAERPVRSLPEAVWARLAQRAKVSSAALVVFDGQRLAGGFAHLGLGFSRARPLWLKPPFLGGIETRVEVVRRRRGRGGDSAHLRFEPAA